MSLIPLPKEKQSNYDLDSLVYLSDTEFAYSEGVPKTIIDDILNKEMMVYGGFYHFESGWKSPIIFLLCRGKRSGKFKLKIQGFLPYCYVIGESGDFKTYLGRTCEKFVLQGQHPHNIKYFRESQKQRGFPTPLEADILFVRRFLMDTYTFFKPKEIIQPKIAIVDIETNFPESDDIISFAINPQDGGDIYYASKYDSEDWEELVLDLYGRIQEYDVIGCWMGEDLFDIKIIEKNLQKLYKTNEEINPKLNEHVVVVDLLEISHKMHGREIRGNWSLDNAGKRLCGIAKSLDEDDMKLDVRELPEEKLMIYNIIDTIIPEVIDNHLGGLEGHLILAWSLQSMLEDVMITAVVNDIALIRAYHKQKQVLNSREYTDDNKKVVKYRAAEPDAREGVYNGIITLDLIHAYPSAVISKNISPETKDEEGKNIAPNGVRFNDNPSVFIDTLKELMKERKVIKTKLKQLDKEHPDHKRYKSIDFALKTQIAAFSHGIFGWSNSRMKDYATADAITAVVRDILDKIKTTCDLTGLKWVYVHTDSCYVNARKEDSERILNYLNSCIKKHCEGYKITPELEMKGFFPIGYIHSPARNVLVPEGVEIDDDENWEESGMNFARSETPLPLGNIEIELIKMKLKGKGTDEMLVRLEEMIMELPEFPLTELALIKPFNKRISEYGKPKKDGSMGSIPFHIAALKRAQEEYGLKIPLKEKFGILPIITDEFTGVRVRKRKKVMMAFDLEKGLPENYKIDFETYLDGNLFGKINGLFGLKTKDLKNLIMSDRVKERLTT